MLLDRIPSFSGRWLWPWEFQPVQCEEKRYLILPHKNHTVLSSFPASYNDNDTQGDFERQPHTKDYASLHLCKTVNRRTTLPTFHLLPCCYVSKKQTPTWSEPQLSTEWSITAVSTLWASQIGWVLQNHSTEFQFLFKYNEKGLCVLEMGRIKKCRKEVTQWDLYTRM